REWKPMNLNLRSIKTFNSAATFALLLSLPSLAGAQAKKAAQLPADLTAFVTNAQELLAKGDAAALRELAEKPNTLSWVEQRTGRGQTNWKLAALALPKPSDGYLGVFYDFHTCESIGDH